MEASVRTYNPEVELVVHHVERSTFGESYNKAMEEAFQDSEEIIIANDDIVVLPNSVSVLLEDVQAIKNHGVEKIGLVASITDNAKMHQSIQFIPADKRIIKSTNMVMPIFAWISREAFREVQFPPLNWFSDDVMCEDLMERGYTHFLSRSYVHHVGSTTIGRDEDKHFNEALPWLTKNRPHHLKRWILSRQHV
jgi:GT2 family glycosyltransferase